MGDDNLTKVTQIPGGSAANGVTQYYFDWRDRLVVAKAGVEGTESTSLNRPIFYTEFDNLGEAIAEERYDGDIEWSLHDTRNRVSRTAFPNGVWERGRASGCLGRHRGTWKTIPGMWQMEVEPGTNGASVNIRPLPA